jgi:hypothetical protein
MFPHGGEVMTKRAGTLAAPSSPLSPKHNAKSRGALAAYIAFINVVLAIQIHMDATLSRHEQCCFWDRHYI